MLPTSAQFRSYWNETRRPLVCLAFALPLLAIYEVAVWSFPNASRNGADVWMRNLLGVVGLRSTLVLPVVVVGVLLAWHHMSRQPWRIPRGVLLGMTVESVLIGLALRAVAPFLFLQLPGDRLRIGLAVGPIGRALERLVEYIGAGVYEEVLFRLLLLSGLIALFSLKLPRPRAIVLAAIVSSLLFSAAHHIGPLGDPFTLRLFLFRALAGGLFAVVFLYRGFGIAIGAHAMYDILVGLS